MPDDEIARALQALGDPLLEVKTEPEEEGNDAWDSTWWDGWWDWDGAVKEEVEEEGVKSDSSTQWDTWDQWSYEHQPQQTPDEKTAVPDSDHQTSYEDIQDSSQWHAWSDSHHWAYTSQHDRQNQYQYGSGKGSLRNQQNKSWAKGWSKGKHKTKSKIRKPAWAYQHWRDRQMVAGKAANKGKRDDYGGIYTEDGYRDHDGNEWERLGHI